MIYVSMIFMLMLLLLLTITTKDVLNPAVISGAVWGLIYILILIFRPHYLIEDSLYSTFAFASVAFSMGVLISYPSKKITNNRLQYSITWNDTFGKLILFINYCAAFSWIVSSYSYFRSGGHGIWVTIRKAVSENDNLNSSLSGIFQNIVLVYFLVSLTYFVINKTPRNRKNLVLGVPPLVMVLLMSYRGVWFFEIITSLAIIFIVECTSNYKIVKIAILGAIVFVVVFFFSSLLKYAAYFTFLNLSWKDKIDNLFTGYFLGPPVAFVNWIKSNPKHYNGNYTFRFLMAILKKIGFNVNVVNNVQDFISVDGIRTNVYTALQWYASDFGITYAILVEFILGFFMGLIYKKVRNRSNPSVFVIILYAMLIYPIINQFFDEKLFSITSIWIQRIIILYIFTKTKFSLYRDTLD